MILWNFTVRARLTEVNDTYVHIHISFDHFAITLVNEINGLEWISIVETTNLSQECFARFLGN